MLKTYIVQKQLKDNFLYPSNKQLKRLCKYKTYKGIKKVNNQTIYVMQDGTWLNDAEYNTHPDVFLATLIDDFWTQYKQTLEVIYHPLSYLGLRSLYEQAYRKLIFFEARSDSERKVLATKNWLCNFGIVMNGGGKSDEYLKPQYDNLLSLLKGDDKKAYTDIKNNDFNISDVSEKLNRLFGTGLEKIITNNKEKLFHPLLDKVPDKIVSNIVGNYKIMHGYAHLNSGNVSYLKLISRGDEKSNQLRRMRSFLCLVGYQVLMFTNEFGDIPKTDLTQTQKFIKRISLNLPTRA